MADATNAATVQLKIFAGIYGYLEASMPPRIESAADEV